MKDTINKLYTLFLNRHMTPRHLKTPLNDGMVRKHIRDDIINLSVEIKNIYPHYSSEPSNPATFICS